MAIAKKNVLDILGNYEDGKIVYKFEVLGKLTKLAKYQGMRIWLQEQQGTEEIIKVLDNFHFVCEMNDYERACAQKDKVSKKKNYRIMIEPSCMYLYPCKMVTKMFFAFTFFNS